jgi:hypothetical protein
MNFKDTFQIKGRIYIFYIPASHGITKANTTIPLTVFRNLSLVPVAEYYIFGGIFSSPLEGSISSLLILRVLNFSQILPL